MIPLGTPCLVKLAPAYPRIEGYYCTIIGHRPDGHNLAELKNGELIHGADRCFMPLRPDPLLDLNNVEIVRKARSK